MTATTLRCWQIDVHTGGEPRHIVVVPSDPMQRAVGIEIAPAVVAS